MRQKLEELLKKCYTCNKSKTAKMRQLPAATCPNIYTRHGKHTTMSTKNVYSVRIPTEIREMMKEMEDIDWQKEIRTMIEELVRTKHKKRLLTEAKKLRNHMKAIDAAELIREDRDAR